MEINTDIITLFPRQARYRVWEELMIEQLDNFQEIIVVLTNDELYGRNQSRELRRDLPYFAYLSIEDAKSKTDDWRDTAMKHALLHSKAERVLFLEPDFFIRDMHKVINDDKSYDLMKPIGVEIDKRTHPCFLCVSRADIEKTDKDFSAYPNKGLDHFDLFTSQLPPVQLLGRGQWHHMAGLTHNMRLENQGKKVVYKPDEYKLYKILEDIIGKHR